MKADRDRPWFVIAARPAGNAFLAVLSTYLVLNALFWSKSKPSHDLWWFWPVTSMTALVAISGVASLAWAAKQRLKTKHR